MILIQRGKAIEVRSLLRSEDHSNEHAIDTFSIATIFSKEIVRGTAQRFKFIARKGAKKIDRVNYRINGPKIVGLLSPHRPPPSHTIFAALRATNFIACDDASNANR